jgi:hypothetical protein
MFYFCFNNWGLERYGYLSIFRVPLLGGTPPTSAFDSLDSL